MFRFSWMIVLGVILTASAPGQIWIEHAGGPHVQLTTLTLQPAVREYVDQPETDARIRRLTDVSEYSTSLTESFGNYNGNPRAGLHNGYSRFPCVSIDNQYILAYGTTPLTVLIRNSDLMPIGMPQTAMNSTGKLGDLDEIKWSTNPLTPHRIGYTAGSRYYFQDVISNLSWNKIIPYEWIHGDFGATIISTADGDWDNNSRFIAEKTYWPGSTGAARVLMDGQLLPGAVVQNGINGVDISPSGRFLKVDNRFFDLPSMEYRNRNEPGHGGWVRGRDGRDWYVNQNSRTDWVEAFDPETSETLYLMRMSEIGANGIHVASAKRGYQYAGFALISTYGGSGPLADNIFYLELKNQKPGLRHPYYSSGSYEGYNAASRLWNSVQLNYQDLPYVIRVAHNQNKYVLYQTVETATDGTTKTTTVGEYQTEAFASESTDGDIYVGSNWHAQDNIELYRIEMPLPIRRVLQTGLPHNAVLNEAWLKLED